jgi:VanZ family protein
VAPERLVAFLLVVAFWIPLIICTYLAFDPSPPDVAFGLSDIALHGFAFSYLTFALGLAYQHRHWLVPGAWMIAYGLFIETVQAFEPERSAEFKDLVVDLAGICFGLWLTRGIGPWVRSAASGWRAR